MSLYDDMADLDAFFEDVVKNGCILHNTQELEGLQVSWKRVSDSHADMERSEMKTEAVIHALATIFRTFNLTINPPEKSDE